MPLFPEFFRLTSHTDRRYRLFLEGPLPAGPAGPAGPTSGVAFHQGTGEPGEELGKEGDVFLSTDLASFYVKTDDPVFVWQLVGQLITG